MLAKRYIKVLGIMILVLMVASSSFAGGHKKDGCGKKDWDSMLLKKMGICLKNQEEVGLTDKQFDAIKEAKYDFKKEIIKNEAEIDIIAVDIKSHLWEDKIDTSAVDKLIDKKYEVKKTKAKAFVAALANFKETLSDDQYKKMKEIYYSKDCKK